MNIDDVLNQTTPARREVRICLRGDIGGAIDVLKERWLEAVEYDREHNEPPTAPAIWDRIAGLEQQADEATVTFVVEALGASAYRRLVAEHPPDPDDLDGWRWNAETFPIAIVAACTVEPAMDETQAAALAERLSNAQWSKLYTAAMAVNVGDDLVKKFATATAPRPTSEPSSTTAPSEESPIASS